VIDDQHFDRTLFRVEFEAQLHLNGAKEIRRRFIFGRVRRSIAATSSSSAGRGWVRDMKVGELPFSFFVLCIRAYLIR